MEDEQLERIAPCSSLAVESIIRVGTARSIAGFGFQCGLVAGIFTSTRCGLQRYRRKDDLFYHSLVHSKTMKSPTDAIIEFWKVNSLVAGAAAGAAVAASTRSWSQVVGTTCLVSILCATADYFK
ncbi:hypothetical protein TIFTF001_007256 [Ficus carica]|uniref:Uncharacterized protein n=1 Tax=Ficus carica TaxID=3494 RepID=A0AA87ZQS9_FICCA|nr:hypothetical protein TIFTF001_007256 [Ficus carica]